VRDYGKQERRQDMKLFNRKKENQRLKLLAVLTVISVMALFILPGITLSGSLEPSGPPSGTMHTLDDIYYKINSLTCDQAYVEKTGQTTSYSNGDDGYHEKGMRWPDPRFTNNGDGTTTDNLTGLVWMTAPCWSNDLTWAEAITMGNSLHNGDCDLTDGSTPGQWRLPNRSELLSLIDVSQIPALPTGHPGGSGNYWTSTTYIGDTNQAWYVSLSNGEVRTANKTVQQKVLPVRNAN
jgi:hypothetical protein